MEEQAHLLPLEKLQNPRAIFHILFVKTLYSHCSIALQTNAGANLTLETFRMQAPDWRKAALAALSGLAILLLFCNVQHTSKAQAAAAFGVVARELSSRVQDSL